MTAEQSARALPVDDEWVLELQHLPAMRAKLRAMRGADVIGADAKKQTRRLARPYHHLQHGFTFLEIE